MLYKKRIMGLGAAAMLCGMAATAQADALLFPYLASSPSVTSIVSIVNNDDDGRLLLRYFYKPTSLGNSESCQTSGDIEIDSAPRDLVSFSANGEFNSNFTDTTGGPLFNDPAFVAEYRNNNFTMGPLSQPRRAFLLVDDDDNLDGEDLHGEAIILERGGGAAWGYRAFNAADDNALPAVFDSSSPNLPGVINDVLGEALDEENDTDTAPVTLLPTDDWITLFFVTPLEDNNQGVCTDCSVTFNLTQDKDGLNAGVFDRDTNPVPGSNPINVVCVTGVNLEQALPASALAVVGSQGGWGYVDIDTGSGTSHNEDAAMVIKLEFNKAGVQTVAPNGANTFNGTVNTAVILRNRDGSQGIGGF